MKKYVIAILSLMLIISGCGSAEKSIENETITEALSTTNKEDLAWLITVDTAEKVNDFSKSQSVAQYSGDVANVTYKQTPSANKTFLLLKLTIKKQIAGKNTFSWDNCFIVDENGTEYSRMADDTFLENFGFKRLKSVDLTLGENTGYLCAEVDEKATKFWIVYKTENGVDKIEVSLD